VGIIDTLSAGFDRLTKRLWLIVIPVLVDIGIWLGPKLSLNKLARQAIASLPSASEMGPQYEQTMAALSELLTDVARQTNVLSVLSMRLLGLPSLSGSIVPTAPAPGSPRLPVEIPTWSALLGVLALLTAASLLLACFCLALLAQEVRDEDMDLRYVLGVTSRSWRRLGTLLLVLLLTGAVVSTGVGLLAGLVAFVSLEFAALLVNLFGLAFMGLAVYGAIVLFFTSRAIILDDTGTLQSIWSSLNVVQRNLLPTIGFLLLVNVLHTGLLYIWRMLPVNVLGMLIGITGNAYVSTGLAMASLIFYRDRFTTWQESKSREGKA